MTDYYTHMINIDLDIDMLRCFSEVAKTGSFTKAGENIGLTQSGVSIKIRRLEERLDSQIFVRANKKLSLTIEGEILLDYAKKILSIHDEAVIQLTKPKASGKLRVGLIDYFIPDLLPNLLTRFRDQYPNIHLEVYTGFGTNLIPQYERGELDMVVAGKDSYTGKCKVLAQEPLVWVMGENCDLSPEDKLNLAILPSPCSFRQYATETLDEAGINWEIVFTGTSIANIQAAVEAGIGISILPSGALKKGLRKAPAKLQLPELPMYSLVVIFDEDKDNDVRDVFISYLESELDNIRISI